MLEFLLQLNAVNRNGAIGCIPIDALHAVIADFIRIKITAVTLAAAVTNAIIIEYAHFWLFHSLRLPCC